MTEVPLDTFDFDYNGGSTSNTISRRLFQNPFFTGDTLSRGTKNRLNILGSWSASTATNERRYAWQDEVIYQEPDRRTIRPLLLYLVTEFIAASVALFAFVEFLDQLPILVTSIGFGLNLLLFIGSLLCGRASYPGNVLAYHACLANFLVLIVHCLKHYNNTEDLTHPIGVSLIICLASALWTLAITLLPSPRVDNQMLYVIPPVIVTGFLSTFVSFVCGRPIDWVTLQLIPTSLGLMLPSAILTAFCISGYNLTWRLS